MTGVACTRPANEAQPVPSETVAVSPAQSGAPLALASAGVPGAPQAAPETIPAAVAERPMSEDPKLLELRNELQKDGHDKALARIAHYRPLCDKDGYPLVGNMFRKSPTPEYQPSALCTEVRKKP